MRHRVPSSFPKLLAVLLAAPVSSRAANYEVYPGSAFYLDQMLDRASWSFVASQSSGIYHHPVGFNSLTDAQETTYTSHFTNRFAMVEGDMGNGSTTGDVPNLQRMTELGLTPVAAFVNRPSTNLSVWRQLIRNNAAQGAPSYEMLAPHRLDDSPLGWYDPIRDYARANMLVPGCIGSGVDAPVYLYVHEGAAYRQTIYDLRDWSVANGRRFNYLVSPNNSYDAALLADTQFTVRDLEDKGHEPDVYGVVLYGERPVDLTPEKVTVNGVDQAATTITGLAYYLIKHRDGEPGTLDLSAFRNGTDHAAGTTSPVLDNPAQTVVLPTSGASTWTIRLANGSPWLDYAGTLRARVQGAASDWQITFNSGGDITPLVLSDMGRAFLGAERWMPGTTRTVTMTVTPKVASPGTIKLILEALPHAMIDHALDVMAFTSGSTGNTPPTLAFEARPRITREALPLGTVWFTCGDAETPSTSLVVTASSSNTVLVPPQSITFGQSGIQRWIRIVPATGQWGNAEITITASDGSLSTSRTFTLNVERTTVLPVVKANNTQSLETGSSWLPGTVPGIADQGVWDSTVTSANSSVVSSPLTVAGLRVTNPGGKVTIQADSPLTLGVSGVDLSSSTRDLALKGTVSLDESATWSVATNRIITVADGLSGIGGLTKSGNGRLDLLGADSFIAALSVTAGELVKTGTGTQSSTSVSNNGILRISHSGGFGTGGLSIGAANSSTGRVEISGNISVLTGKTVTINSRTSNTDAIVSSGDNTLGGNIAISTGGSLCSVASNTGNLEFTGNVSCLATGSRSLTLRGAANGRLSGTASNGSGTLGLFKSGDGTWTLDGNHSFTGSVTVQQGTLIVKQPLPTQPVSVSSGATLSGGGTLGGDVTISGIHSPGIGVGSQTTGGLLTYAAGAKITWEIGGQQTQADLITAGETAIGSEVRIDIVANTSGGTVDYSHAFWNQTRQWPVIAATNLTGTPILGDISADSLGNPAAPFGSFSVVATPTGVVLQWTPSSSWDRWLYQNFGGDWTNPQIAGPGSDPDGDGWDNESEWVTGTGPRNPASRFTIACHGNAVSFERVDGRIYQVQTSTDPAGPWLHHAYAPPGAGLVEIPGPPNPEPRRFFRVIVSLAP